MSFFFDIVELLCEVLTLLIVIRVIVSWITSSYTNPITNILFQVTEPILSPLRRIIPRFGVLDFSPMVAILAFQLIIILLP